MYDSIQGVSHAHAHGARRQCPARFARLVKAAGPGADTRAYELVEVK